MPQRPTSRPSGGDAPRGDWRNAGKKAAVKRDTPLYQQAPTGNAGLWWKRVLSLGLVFVLVLLFIAVMRWIPRSTPLVVVSVTNYDSPAPPNGWAEEDAAAFAASWPLTGAWRDNWNNVCVEVERQPPPTSEACLDSILALLDKHPAGGPSKNVRLLYLSAHGLVDNAGEPCLLLSNKRDDAATAVWPRKSDKSAELPLLSLPQLITKLREQSKERGGARYVVLLETGRIDSAWQLGVLENDFAASMAKYMDANASAGHDSVVVINSASPGELGIAYPEYGGSGFGMFVKAGLLGAADASGDKKVTLHELRDYLRQQVNVLAKQNRYRTQTPQLWPEKVADFPIAYAQDNSADPLAQLSPGTTDAQRERWAQVSAVWSKHSQILHYHDDRTRTDSILDRQLPSVAALEQGLLRLDQLCDAGAAYSAEFQSLLGKLDQLAGKLLDADRTSQAYVETTMPQPAADADPAAGSPGPKVYELELLQTILQGGEKKAEALVAWNKLSLATQQHYVWRWFSRGGDLPLEAALTTLTAEATPADLAREPVGIRTLRRYRGDGYLPPEIAADRPLLGKMIALREAPETFASGAGDLRAQYVAVPYVNAADAQRRAAEDRLFVGDAPGAEAAAVKAAATYDAKVHDSRNIASWLSMRDVCWRELPHYADWAITAQRESPGGTPQRKTADQHMAAVRAAIELDGKLTQAIEWLTEAARGEAATTDQVALTSKINELGAALLGERLKLRSGFNAAITECSAGAHDRANLAQLLRVLRVPLSSPSRVALRERYLKILAQQRELSLAKAGESSASGIGPTDLILPADIETLAKQGEHPAAQLWAVGERFPVAIAGLKLGDLAPVSSQSNQDQQHHTRLDTVEIAKRAANIREIAATSARNKLSGGDEQCRASLAFVTLPPTFGEAEAGLDHPQRKLRDFDRHHYLVWQAERTIEDFWGSADAPVSAVSQGDYFALLADDYLEQASRLYSNQSPPLLAAQQKLAARKLAATQLLSQVVAADIYGKPIEGETTFERAIRWPDSELKGRVAGLPVGQAAIYPVSNASGRGSILLRAPNGGEFRHEFAQPLTSTGEQTVLPTLLEFKFRDDMAVSIESSFDLVFYYRGHAERQLVGIGKLAPGPVVEWKKAAAKRPQVVLKGDLGSEKNLGSVAILLDCSHSMDEPFEQGKNRMQVALTALGEITTELEKAGQKDYTVWLFGHRRYMPTLKELDDPKINLGGGRFKVDWNPIFGAADDERIGFHNDVQQVWPAVKNVPPLRDLLNPEQGLIRPWGRTPLYTAMYQAITQDLAKRDKSALRRMIVLSDGDHFVRNNKDERITYVPKWNYDPAEDKSAADVANAFKGDFGDNFEQRIRLHVVDLTGGAASKIRTDQVVDTVSGNFHAVQNLDELKRILKDAAGLHQYAVFDESRQDYVVRNVQINTIEEFESYAGRKFSIRLEGINRSESAARFSLGGGETITYGVKYEGNAPRVIPVRTKYEGKEIQNIANPVRLANDDDYFPKDFHVTLITPRRTGTSDIEFRIAIENQNIERFSPRPKAAWIEIEPGNMIEGEWQPAGEKYIFNDLAFQDGQPVPVLRNEARNWPRAAKLARVQAWFSLQDWSAANSEELRKLRVATADDEESFKLKPAGLGDNVRFAVQLTARPAGGALVTVTQMADSDRPPPLKITISGDPDVIRRQYYRAPNAGRVQHVFEFHNVSTDALLAEFVDIRTLSSLEPTAAKLKDPVIINVPEN